MSTVRTARRIGLGRKVIATAAVTLAVVALAACSSDRKSPGPDTPAAATKVRLQLLGVTQAQFAGYIAAVDRGFYAAQGLDVSLLQGGSDIVPQAALAKHQADYAIAWVSQALQSREQGAPITDVGQVFQRSGTVQVSFKAKNITTPAALKGKTVGDWGVGNEYELFAGMTKNGLSPGKDVRIVQQQFDMKALLNNDIDAAQAMIYNEYAQVLEAKNPATGNLYQASDLNVIDWNDVGTAMLQDAIWADTNRLSDPAYQATTVKFLTASYQGWIYCASNAAECRDLVVKAGSRLGASHQLWQLNEVNKLVWPSPAGIGIIDKQAWDQTVRVASSTRNIDGAALLRGVPVGNAYTNTYTEQALAKLRSMNLDTKNAGFTPIAVTLNPGGS